MASLEKAIEVKSRDRLRTVVLLVVWAISIGYMAIHLKVGWVPHDEGMLGLSAERVLQGQLPHRDFDDYTGGLTFVHAGAFRIFGISSASMRVVLFVFFVAWIPAVFYVASQFGSAISAGAVTLLAMAWSVPNYPGPMPSWYNLFFATWGIAAVLRYLDAGSRNWLFFAGLCGGFSMLAKIAAAYYVAGVLLFFLFREQSLASERNHGTPTRAWFYTATATTGLTVFLILLFRMVHTVPGISGVVYFFLPAFGLVVLLLKREFAGIPGGDQERFAVLSSQCGPFLAGIAVPILFFMIPYVRAGAIRDLVHGLISTPSRAIRFASFDPHHPLTMISVAPFLIPVLVAYECGRIGRAICACFVGLYGLTILLFAGKSTLVYYLGWCALGTAIPLMVLGGVAILWRSQTKWNQRWQQQVLLLLCVTALCSVIQFPFSAPIYFFYIAPLVILSCMALFASTSRGPVFVNAVLIAIYFLFPTLPVTAYQMGISHAQDGKTQKLSLGRAGGLRVDSIDAQLYDALIPVVQSHAKDKFIYAAPDCPEVYFLSGLRSPSRHYFDYVEDPQRRNDRILEMLDGLQINVVVISQHAQFTGPLWPDLQKLLERRYISSINLGSFQVRWKER